MKDRVRRSAGLPRLSGSARGAYFVSRNAAESARGILISPLPAFVSNSSLSFSSQRRSKVTAYTFHVAHWLEPQAVQAFSYVAGDWTNAHPSRSRQPFRLAAIRLRLKPMWDRRWARRLHAANQPGLGAVLFSSAIAVTMRARLAARSTTSGPSPTSSIQSNKRWT
jgi:hypothetical protein